MRRDLLRTAVTSLRLHREPAAGSSVAAGHSGRGRRAVLHPPRRRAVAAVPGCGTCATCPPVHGGQPHTVGLPCRDFAMCTRMRALPAWASITAAGRNLDPGA